MNEFEKAMKWKMNYLRAINALRAIKDALGPEPFESGYFQVDATACNRAMDLVTKVLHEHRDAEKSTE